MSFLSYTILFVQALLIAAVSIYLNAPLWLIIFVVGQNIALSMFLSASLIKTGAEPNRGNA